MQMLRHLGSLDRSAHFGILNDSAHAVCCLITQLDMLDSGGWTCSEMLDFVEQSC